MSVNEKSRLIAEIQRLEEEVRAALHPATPADWLHTDLTMPQLKILIILFRDGPARMSELAQRMGITLATTTGVIDRLVERRLVVREGLSEDRRVVICRLSEEGEALVDRLWESGPGRVQRLLEAMSAEQLAILAQALQITLSAAKSTNPTSTSA